MSEGDRAARFTRLLSGAGRAHHEAVGGPNPGWSRWYAEYLVGHDIAAHVGFQPTVDEVASWLEEADRRHSSEASDRPWPPYYADVILSALESDPRSAEHEA